VSIEETAACIENAAHISTGKEEVYRTTEEEGYCASEEEVYCASEKEGGYSEEESLDAGRTDSCLTGTCAARRQDT
jgi:hypothetical protein